MYPPEIVLPDHSPVSQTAKTHPESRRQARRRTPHPDHWIDRVPPSRAVLPRPYFRIVLPILLPRLHKGLRLPCAHPAEPTPTHAGPFSPPPRGGRTMPEWSSHAGRPTLRLRIVHAS